MLDKEKEADRMTRRAIQERNIEARRDLQKEMSETRRKEKEEDRLAANQREFERQRFQIGLAERRSELKVQEQEIEGRLQLLEHELTPERLGWLTDDYARRRSIDVQAYRMEVAASTDAEIRRIQAEGDERRQIIRTELRSRLAEKLLESKLEEKRMKLAHEQAKELAMLQAAGAREVSTQTLDDLEAMVRKQIDGQEENQS